MIKKGKLSCVAALGLGISFLGTATPVHATETLNVVQQNAACRGTITDKAGEPIIGATVKVKGQSTGAITDVDGNFTLQNAGKGAILQVSYVGYVTQEVKWNGDKLSIVLQEDSKSLDELVVIGYGTVRKADLAGSVSVVDDKSFRDQPITCGEDALNGRVSGVTVMSSGVPGGSMRIRVRGVSSVNKSNDPLYVIDGMVRQDGMNGLNPEDIQSIQVLKDASSTAIYGARGANGVVLVTTKTGKAGQQSIVFDASVGVANAYHIPKVMGTQEYAQALIKYGKATEAQVGEYANGSNPGIDWMDELLQTGVVQNYKVAISKGNQDTQYYISANAMNNKGTILGTSHTRYSLKANIHSNVTKWFGITADVNLAQVKVKGVGFGQDKGNMMWLGLNYSPSMEMKNAEGVYNSDPYNSIGNNPVGSLLASDNDRLRSVAQGHVDLKFNILPGLTFTSSNGADYSDRRTYSFGSSNQGLGVLSSMGNGDTYRLMLQSTNNLTYTHRWDKHSLTATGVWEVTEQEQRGLSINGRDLVDENVTYWDVNSAKTITADNSYQKWQMLSGVARVIYSYNDTYMFTGTLRADGSSRFTNKKWGWFPSAAVAWTVTNESWMQKVRDVMNDLKIRASYGLIGNQDISPYSTLGTLGTTNFNLGTLTNFTGYWANGLATPDLTWEKVHQFDIGFDAYFFNNRLNISFDYFSKKTTDALLQKTAPQYLGAATYWTNAGEVSNKGFDITVGGRIFDSKDFAWESTLNASYVKNEVLKLTDDDPFLYGASPAPGVVDPCTIIKEGQPIGTFYLYKWAGVQKNSDGKYVDMYYTKDGSLTATPGGDDRFEMGKGTPDWTLGWNNRLRWKNWELNAFFNAAFGAKRLNLVRYAMCSMPGDSRFVTEADYFSLVGTEMADLDAEGNKSYGNSSKWLENANYFRLENVSLAYNFDRKVTKFADIRLALSVQNVFTITSYKGNDPAGGSFSASNVDNNNGIDMGAYPMCRTFTFNVRFTF